MSTPHPIRFLLFILLVIVLCPLGSAQTVGTTSSDKLRDEVSYTNDIRPVVENFCTTCHAGEDPEGDFVLTSYEDVLKHTKNGDLLQRINDEENPMPQSGLMPQYMRRLFRLWADQGYRKQGNDASKKPAQQMSEFKPTPIKLVDSQKQGFELLQYIQGHWVGSMNLMGQEMEWMAFDFRPIAPSHVHAIFEGGTIGNLFTSFFVAEIRGKQTIVARNGGILNGIYRTSYFALDQVKYGRDWAYYRLVDAHGGKDIMYMELTFQGDSLEFNAYTSRFGLTEVRPHMAFKARRMHPDLAASAARDVGFPKNTVDYRFPDGFPTPAWAKDYPMTSASYTSEEMSKSLIELGKVAKDPRRIDQMPYLAQLTVEIERTPATRGKKLLVYLSRDALTDAHGEFITQYGYIREDLLNTLLLFPELAKNQSDFTFTYLHPGEYYLTVIADMDGDGFPSPGDITHSRRKVRVRPLSKQTVRIDDLRVKN